MAFNNRFLRERGMASKPKMEYIPGFSLHFPKELSYGYLRFEGNGKWENFFRKVGKKVYPVGCLSLAKLNFFPSFPKEFYHFLQT